MKKVYGPSNEELTSFHMKYRVEKALKDRIYETEEISNSLKQVLEYEFRRESFVGVSNELRNIGVTDIEIDFVREYGGLLFKGTFSEPPEDTPNNFGDPEDGPRGLGGVRARGRGEEDAGEQRGDAEADGVARARCPQQEPSDRTWRRATMGRPRSGRANR